MTSPQQQPCPVLATSSQPAQHTELTHDCLCPTWEHIFHLRFIFRIIFKGLKISFFFPSSRKQSIYALFVPSLMFPQFCGNREKRRCTLNKLYFRQLETKQRENRNMYRCLCCSYELLRSSLCTVGVPSCLLRWRRPRSRTPSAQPSRPSPPGSRARAWRCPTPTPRTGTGLALDWHWALDTGTGHGP